MEPVLLVADVANNFYVTLNKLVGGKEIKRSTDTKTDIFVNVSVL